MISGHGAPVKDWRESGGRCAEEPGQTSVYVREGDGHHGERFPQVFQPGGLGQALLELRSAYGGVQVVGGLRRNGAVVGRQDPHVVADSPFGFLHQLFDDPPYAHARDPIPALIGGRSQGHVVSP
ncbi:hypothetical protein [Streptomyces sp. NPDC006477]|uniref:hypothetical protein n=1 Tax=Streptomyces sp. NPDC006477 TaxID=3364747 RepID=UPI0036C72B73